MELENGGKIKDFRASFGGMAPTTKPFTLASNVIGLDWNDETLEKIQHLIGQEFKLPDNVPGGFAKYRSAMPNSFLIKFFFESKSALLGHQAKVRPNDSYHFSSWTVKLLFVVFGRLSYSFFRDVKSNLSVHAVYIKLGKFRSWKFFPFKLISTRRSWKVYFLKLKSIAEVGKCHCT